MMVRGPGHGPTLDVLLCELAFTEPVDGCRRATTTASSPTSLCRPARLDSSRPRSRRDTGVRQVSRRAGRRGAPRILPSAATGVHEPSAGSARSRGQSRGSTCRLSAGSASDPGAFDDPARAVESLSSSVSTGWWSSITELDMRAIASSASRRPFGCSYTAPPPLPSVFRRPRLPPETGPSTAGRRHRRGHSGSVTARSAPPLSISGIGGSVCEPWIGGTPPVRVLIATAQSRTARPILSISLSGFRSGIARNVTITCGPARQRLPRPGRTPTPRHRAGSRRHSTRLKKIASADPAMAFSRGHQQQEVPENDLRGDPDRLPQGEPEVGVRVMRRDRQRAALPWKWPSDHHRGRRDNERRTASHEG